MTVSALTKRFSAGLLISAAFVLGFSFLTPQVAHAQADCTDENVSAAGISGGADCAQPNNSANRLFGENSVFRAVTNIMLFLIGAVSVIMLIVGGVQYVLSGGEQGKVTSAKNTILYAIVGIVVAFLAYAAVNFVTTQLQQNTDNNAASVPSTSVTV